MTAYKFNPTTYSSPTDWNTPADWLPGVPNAPDADVTIPLITGSGGYAVDFNLMISKSESYAVRSITVEGETFSVSGTLSVSGAFSATYDNLNVSGTLQVGSFSYSGTQGIQVTGLLTSATATVNTVLISGPGTLQFGGFTNNGTLDSVTLSVPTGTFTNLVNGTLTGGTYKATSADLTLGVGDDIVTDAATLVVGSKRIQTTGRTGSIDALGQTLQTVAAGGVLDDVGSYTQSIPLLDAGTITLNVGNNGSATFSSVGITVATGGSIVATGGGTISGPVVIQAGGTVQKALVVNVFGIANLTNLGRLVLTGPVSGAGNLVIQPVAVRMIDFYNTIELAGPTSSDVVFGDQNGILVVDSPALFTGRISGFQSGLDYLDEHIQTGATATHSDAIIEDGVSSVPSAPTPTPAPAAAERSRCKRRMGRRSPSTSWATTLPATSS